MPAWGMHALVLPSIQTLQLPGLDLVEVDLPDDLEVELLKSDLLLEVVQQQLLVGGVEPEARRHAVAG